MARYFIINRTFVETLGSGCGARDVRPGEIVTLADDAKPGVSAFPLDDAARAARLAVLKSRNKTQRATDRMWVNRWREGIPSHLRKSTLDPAIAEFGAYLEAHNVQL